MTNITIDAAAIDLLKVEETQLINKAQYKYFTVDITLKDNCDDPEVRQILGNLFSDRFWESEETTLVTVTCLIIYL
uniref:Uncharacterized protein n=1 Tax=Panagrellus redivivus TaxID=6233 RepID=A0A7E4UY92_PANRE